MKKRILKVINKNQPFALFAFVALGLMMVGACSTDIELNAEPKDIWVVYGVLREEAETQDIRVAKAFLIEGDAIEYAKENDLSEKGLRVTLTDSRGRMRMARQVDSVATQPTDGTFFPYTTVYRFNTAGDSALVPGERYSLRVSRPGDDTFALTAYTYVPLAPQILQPVERPCVFPQIRLDVLQLHNRYDVEWSRGRGANSNPGAGLGFELRAFFNYEKNDEPQAEISWGPTPLIVTPSGCNTSGSGICHRFAEGELINHWLFNMEQDPNARYTFDNRSDCELSGGLARAFRVEVTAIDTFLTNYMRINDPSVTDFNTVRLEYTNISASGSAAALGIFGSTTRVERLAGMDQCSQWLLNMNDTPRPQGLCEI
jgi:hypothetical protein